MNYHKPKVTVLMPVYNSENYLSEAIESILKQTFTDFELLIINDGSTDNSVQIIESYNDPRICLIHNSKNMGLPSTLNKGIDLAQGEFIARMDSDDISHPERLRKQVEFMETHPEIGVCGTWVETIGEKKGQIWKYPINHDEIKISLIFNPPLAHPSVIFRKSSFKKHSLYYDPTLIIAQDFELWYRCSNYLRLANLPEVLLMYRISSSSHFRSKENKHSDILKEIYRRILPLNITLKEDEYKIHRAISYYNYSKDPYFIKKAKTWLEKLHKANHIERKYPEPVFSEALANRWFSICHHAITLGLWTWNTYWRSSLSRYNKISLHVKLKFAFFVVFYQSKIFPTFVSHSRNVITKIKGRSR